MLNCLTCFELADTCFSSLQGLSLNKSNLRMSEIQPAWLNVRAQDKVETTINLLVCLQANDFISSQDQTLHTYHFPRMSSCILEQCIG